ncbi:hypothetical protein H6CHR_01852 [Variovorax sp. PBL-H6]|uniref:hypothetical protein n=1 Tax=Variovorax sp. PBL-H6 TaxID=434009 RepID=UPI00131992C6|nr:hypothetical protein [Variovorax sp. PBL-H6]VTU22762.1 hypothetical protein H6CHR_01852 [Variovorax sp. PBL-H6]
MTINALSAAIGKADIANGDDPLVIYQALQALRCGIMSKALSSTVEATAADMRRAMRVRQFDDLASRLQALPDTPGGKSKVLASFSAGAAGAPSQQMPDGTVIADLDALEDFGLTLPKETWLYTYETSTAAGKGSSPVLTSPQDIAKIRTDCPLAYTQDGIDYYARKTGEGKDEKTTYLAVYQSEGAYCAKDSDISDLSSDLETRLDDATVLLTTQSARLSGLSGELMRDIQQDRPLMKLARDQQEHHDDRHVEAFLDRLQDTPSSPSDARKG